MINSLLPLRQLGCLNEQRENYHLSYDEQLDSTNLSQNHCQQLQFAKETEFVSGSNSTIPSGSLSSSFFKSSFIFQICCTQINDNLSLFSKEQHAKISRQVTVRIDENVKKSANQAQNPQKIIIPLDVTIIDIELKIQLQLNSNPCTMQTNNPLMFPAIYKIEAFSLIFMIVARYVGTRSNPCNLQNLSGHFHAKTNNSAYHKINDDLRLHQPSVNLLDIRRVYTTPNTVNAILRIKANLQMKKISLFLSC
ncbi:UNKNOWN [Stylonychia lemnae]|uniref:Uncharacterized protein n=1 Tax=Stylonychia lemnae TaxID=5949 RepID=A0A077ZR28_STYLE|nr:UNKNOWN [Stylonychia lemnae]|eukprot:CDW71909.1 UNKNOWN [Stylonychia lemnae]